jgi:hypothetical protein
MYAPVVPVSALKTLALSDNGTVQNVTAAVVLTIPLNSAVPFPVGSMIAIKRGSNSGAPSVFPTVGVTLIAEGGVTVTGNQGVPSFAWIRKTATDTWYFEPHVPSNLGLLGTPTAATASVGTNTTQLATTAFVSLSNRPYVRAGRSANQVGLANAVFTKIIWNSVNTDTNGILNTTTGDFTIPAGLGGIYRITVGAGVSAGCKLMAVSLCTTAGVEIQRLSNFDQSSDSSFGGVSIGSTSVLLAASTSYSIQLYQSNTAATTRDIVSTAAFTYFTLCRENV